VNMKKLLLIPLLAVILSSCTSVPISRVYVNRQKASGEFEKALDKYNKETDSEKKETSKLIVYYYLGAVNALDGVLVKHGPQ